MNRQARALIGTALAIGIAAGATACGNKQTQHLNDAPRAGNDSTPARIVAMPDGFSNAAVKCIGPDLIATLFHHDSPYGSVALIKDDANCKGHAPLNLP